MSAPIPPPPPVEPRNVQAAAAAPRQPLRFSMRSLLALMTAVAIACAVTTALPRPFALMITGALWIAGSGWLATGVLFARGDRQAFCLGGLIVVASMWTQSGGQMLEGVRVLLRPLGLFELGSSLTPWLQLALVAAAAAGNGWLCVRARRWHQGPPE
ncbi:MAG: hypothetical protein CMJ58_24930 [Planctomycetaceae bacterium]|nr:hypothetical protein [Planctomycetaceae bacterium]